MIQSACRSEKIANLPTRLMFLATVSSSRAHWEAKSPSVQSSRKVLLSVALVSNIMGELR